MKTRVLCGLPARAVLACSVLLSASLSYGGSVIARSLNDRKSTADQIVDGVVTRVEPRYAPSSEIPGRSNIIVSDVTIRVTETLKGAGKSTVRVTVLGGEMPEESMSASHVRVPQVGERGLFFLSRGQDASSAGNYEPTFQGQGMLFVDGNRRIRGSTIDLDELKSKIRGG
jgi:hypothetical protein